MAIKVLREAYDQVTIINLKIDVDVKKFSGGTYKGWVLNFEDKDGELRASKFNSSWINLKWQDALRGQIEALSAGDKVTLLKQKTCDEAKWEGSSEEERKTLGFWGVVSIEAGHVIPSNYSAPAAAASVANENRDSLPIELGNCLTIANILGKGLSSNELLTLAVKDVRDVQVRLQDTIKAEYPNMNNYSRGARLGQSLILAAERSDLAGLHDEARALFALICKGEDFLRGTPAVEKAVVAPVVEEKEVAPVVEKDAFVADEVADLPW